MISAVRVFGGAEPGILPHGPKAAPVHVRVDASGIWKLARFTWPVTHDREILRARKKEEMPNQPMIRVSGAARSTLGISWSKYARTPLNPKIIARHKKRKPITSFHSVRAGFTTAGTTWWRN